MREQAPIIVHFVRTPRMGEVRFVAVKRKDRESENQECGEPDRDCAGWLPKGPTRSFGHKNPEQSITCRAEYEAPLKTNRWQKRETSQQWTSRCPSRVEQRRQANAIHSVAHVDLD